MAPVSVIFAFWAALAAILSAATGIYSVFRRRPGAPSPPELTWREKMAEAGGGAYRRPGQPSRNPYGVDEKTWAALQRAGPQGMNSPFMQYLQKFL